MAQHSSKLMEAVTRLGESNNIRSECAMGRMELPREATVLEPVLPRYTPEQATLTPDHASDLLAGVDYSRSEERIREWLAGGKNAKAAIRAEFRQKLVRNDFTSTYERAVADGLVEADPNVGPSIGAIAEAMLRAYSRNPRARLEDCKTKDWTNAASAYASYPKGVARDVDAMAKVVLAARCAPLDVPLPWSSVSDTARQDYRAAARAAYNVLHRRVPQAAPSSVPSDSTAPQEHIELATVIMQAWRGSPSRTWGELLAEAQAGYLAVAQRLCFLYHTVDGEVIAQDERLADELREVFHAVFVGSKPRPWAELPRHSQQRWLRALRAGRHWLANRISADLEVMAGVAIVPKPGGVERVNLNNKAQDASDIVLEVAQVLRGNTGNPLTRDWEELAPELRAAWQKAAVYLYQLCAVYNPEDLPEWLLQDCCAAFMGHDNAWTDAHIPLWRSGVKAALRRLYKLRAQA